MSRWDSWHGSRWATSSSCSGRACLLDLSAGSPSSQPDMSRAPEAKSCSGDASRSCRQQHRLHNSSRHAAPNANRRGPGPLEEPAPCRLAASRLGWRGLTPRWPRSLRLGSASDGEDRFGPGRFQALRREAAAPCEKKLREKATAPAPARARAKGAGGSSPTVTSGSRPPARPGGRACGARPARRRRR